MQEKILNTRKNGMTVMLLCILLYVAAILCVVFGAINMDRGNMLGLLLFIPGLVWALLGWIPFCGLKVLKPQEALVLTLFGKYIGTLKGEGFYFVNPFCTGVNPAAATRLNQSGDVDSNSQNNLLGVLSNANNANAAAVMAAESGKKISLKIMTLSNSRQKINDCLGNPIEIGIAVMWRVVDTAKAVFTVDNYKEYLSLQCDSALRDIVRIYPYDVAPGVDTTGDGVADEGSLRGSSETARLRARDRGGHAAASAGPRHHRRAQDDRRRRGRHGRDGARAPEREEHRPARRGAQGGDGLESSCRALRQQGRPARRELRQPVLIWPTTPRSRSRCV